MNAARLKESLIYYATKSCNDKNYKPKLYKGSCETTFKECFDNHKTSFNFHYTNMTPSYQKNIGT